MSNISNIAPAKIEAITPLVKDHTPCDDLTFAPSCHQFKKDQLNRLNDVISKEFHELSEQIADWKTKCDTKATFYSTAPCHAKWVSTKNAILQVEKELMFYNDDFLKAVKDINHYMSEISCTQCERGSYVFLGTLDSSLKLLEAVNIHLVKMFSDFVKETHELFGDTCS
jgi:hypothetical protein